MHSRGIRQSIGFFLLCFSGCAIHTPYKVVRYWADYNTEREWNAQVEIFDHLPPKTARVKVARWGYNVGGDCPSGTGTFGIGTGIWEERFSKLFFWRRWTSSTVSEEVILIEPPIPPGEPPPDLNPGPPPPAPPAEPPSTQSDEPLMPIPPKTSAVGSNSKKVAQVGYQTPKVTTRRAPVNDAAWIFRPASQRPE